MEQKAGKKRVARKAQMALAIQLRASGATYEQIGRALDPSRSKQAAYNLVQKALDEVTEKYREKAEGLRHIELTRMNQLLLALWPRKSDPRTADSIVRISERIAKLTGLDSPQKIEASGPDGGPILVGDEMDLSKLTVEELLELERLHKKATEPAPVEEAANR